MYEASMANPRTHLTAFHMEKIARLLKKDIAVVFWACYKKKPETEAEFKLDQAINRAIK